MTELLRAAGVGEAELDALTKAFRAWRKSRRLSCLARAGHRLQHV